MLGKEPHVVSDRNSKSSPGGINRIVYELVVTVCQRFPSGRNTFGSYKLLQVHDALGLSCMWIPLQAPYKASTLWPVFDSTRVKMLLDICALFCFVLCKAITFSSFSGMLWSPWLAL